MKTIFETVILYVLLIFPTHIVAQTINFQIIDSLTNEPVENVYVYNSKKEFLSVSDKDGMCQIVFSDTTQTMHPKNAYISHIGYAPKILIITTSMSNRTVKILLNPTIFELGEITVTPPNANNIVQKAIENIPKNYPSIRGDTLALSVNFVFFDNPNSKIADFKGNIAVKNDGANLLAAKYAIEKNLINNTFFDYANEISPGAFYSIIPIQNHAPLRMTKKVDFHYDGTLSYQGSDAYKISFIRKGRYTNLSGYMLINKDKFAIPYITYEIGEIKNWIAATQKSKGIVYTNLERYNVCVTYSEDIKGFRFSEGAINVLFNKTNKKEVLSNNTYDMSVKTIETEEVPNRLTYLKVNELFKK